jgi:hypothetical protein
MLYPYIYPYYNMLLQFLIKYKLITVNNKIDQICYIYKGNNILSISYDKKNDNNIIETLIESRPPNYDFILYNSEEKQKKTKSDKNKKIEEKDEDEKDDNDKINTSNIGNENVDNDKIDYTNIYSDKYFNKILLYNDIKHISDLRYKLSNVRFISMVLKFNSIEIKVDLKTDHYNYYIVKNKINKSFVYYLLLNEYKSYYDEYVNQTKIEINYNDFKYEIEIIDDNVNIITLTETQEIVFKKNKYDIIDV